MVDVVGMGGQMMVCSETAPSWHKIKSITAIVTFFVASMCRYFVCDTPSSTIHKTNADKNHVASPLYQASHEGYSLERQPSGCNLIQNTAAFIDDQ